jgi:hypothetical protein
LGPRFANSSAQADFQGEKLMPRISPEARSASIFRAGNKPLPVPKGLKPAAAGAIWRATVGAKPPDYFCPTDQELLTRFCTLSARARELERMLAATPADAPAAGRIERRLLAISATLGNLAQRLRLSPAARIERHSGQRSETWSRPAWDDDDHELLGGRAVSGRR